MDDSVVVSGVSQFVSRLHSDPKIFAVEKLVMMRVWTMESGPA